MCVCVCVWVGGLVGGVCVCVWFGVDGRMYVTLILCYNLCMVCVCMCRHTHVYVDCDYLQ